MEAKFKYPWLVVGDLLKINLNGEIEVKNIAKSLTVENLGNSILDFIDELAGRGKFEWFEVFGCTAIKRKKILRIYMSGSYDLMLEVPCYITFAGGELVCRVEPLDDSARISLFKIDVGDLQFIEVLPYDMVADRMMKIVMKHKIGIPLYMTVLRVEGEFVVFYAPNGDEVLRLNGENYWLRYKAIGGEMTRNGNSILKWLARIIPSKLKSGIEWCEVEGNVAKVKAGDLWVEYDIKGLKLLNFDLWLDDLLVSSREGGVRLVDKKKDKVDAKVWANLGNLGNEISGKLWEILKPFVF